MPEPDDHALGRSRGGFTTKVHALVDQVLRPVGLLLTPGQAHDNPQLMQLLDDYQGCRRSAGRVTVDIHLVADKAYSHPSTRAALGSRRVRHTIPERSDQRKRRTARGSRGGRPPNFDEQLYARRNTVERSFGRLKSICQTVGRR